MATPHRAAAREDLGITHHRVLVAWFLAEQPAKRDDQYGTLSRAIRSAAGPRGASSMPINAALSTTNAIRYPRSQHDLVGAFGPLANHARHSLVDRSHGRRRLERWELDE